MKPAAVSCFQRHGLSPSKLINTTDSVGLRETQQNRLNFAH